MRALSIRYSVGADTVQKRKKRLFVADMSMGLKTPASTLLSSDEEAVIVTFRKHTLLPLDDCLYARAEHDPAAHSLKPACCLQRHGINRLPDMDGDKPIKKRFKAYPIGDFPH